MIDTVAALFVDPRGPYPRLVSEWYDADRDARRYGGGKPVIAHPPCGPWGRLRHLSKHDDPMLAVYAIGVVRACGGVLEHPAHSKLWEQYHLPKPGAFPDAWGGVTVHVDQCDFGHVARKATWLYIVGLGTLPTWPAKGTPTHWISGGHGRVGKKSKPTPVPDGIKICSAQQRRRTPEAFAQWLIAIASSVRRRNPT